MNLLPSLPENPEERQAFIRIWIRELQQFRRRPSFIVGMVMAGASAFTLIYLSGNAARLAIIGGMSGVCLIYDTLTRHFCTVLLNQERSVRSGPTAAPHPPEGTSSAPH